MLLTLAEKFLLLSHHPEKSRYLVSEHILNVGMIGALLLDLAHEKKLRVEGEIMWVSESQTKLSATHHDILKLISKNDKPRKIKRWVSKLNGKSKQYRHGLLASLEEKGVLKVEHKKFLFFPYLKTYLLDYHSRNILIDDIRQMIFEDKTVIAENTALLGLIDACKMYKLISENKNEIKYSKAKIKTLVQEDAIAQGVDQVISAIQTALIATLAATIATTTAASTSSSS